jgi:hypothetical protein
MKHGLATNQKALSLNLDESIYGTFAEIGAGQEVANNFFKAGAASGTVAKTMSAYDMIFSDTIYGKEKTGRYVCESRVRKMMNYEYDLLIERLGKVRENTKFFAFADTISARNFQGTNEAHGWIALKFHHEVDSKPSEIVMHIRMHDNTNLLQQQAIGILGVNIIYQAYYHQNDIGNFIDRLQDNLNPGQIEINMIAVDGPAFKMDNRLLNLQLVYKNYTPAIMFDENGKACLATDKFYKQNVMAVRGSYRPPTKVNLDIIKTARSNFSTFLKVKEKDIFSFAEITLSNLKADGNLAESDFLARIDLINCLGEHVLVSNFAEYHKLSSYLNDFRAKNVALVLGAYNFKQIFDEDYSGLQGGILTALGKLLQSNVHFFLYPYKEDEKATLIDSTSLPMDKKYAKLYEHVKNENRIHDLKGYDESLLHIFSRKVLKMIRKNEKGWEQYVPEVVAKIINEHCLFDHPCDHKK